MPNQIKQDKISELKEKIKSAKSIAIVDYQGLGVNDFNEFRQKIKGQDGDTVIAKNTLIKLALEEEGYKTEEYAKELKGPNAAIIAYKDPVAYFKTIFDFSARLDLPKIKFAIIDRVYTSAQNVEVISKLPSKEQLLAQVVGGLKSPLSGLVNVLGGTQRKFVTVLSRIAEKKE